MSPTKSEYVTISTTTRTRTEAESLIADTVRGTGDSGTVSWSLQGMTDATVTYRITGPATAVDRVVGAGSRARYW